MGPEQRVRPDEADWRRGPTQPSPQPALITPFAAGDTLPTSTPPSPSCAELRRRPTSSAPDRPICARRSATTYPSTPEVPRSPLTRLIVVLALETTGSPAGIDGLYLDALRLPPIPSVSP